MSQSDNNSHVLFRSITRLGKQSFLYVVGDVLTQILATVPVPVIRGG